jgi:hypothetical protein
MGRVHGAGFFIGRRRVYARDETYRDALDGAARDGEPDVERRGSIILTSPAADVLGVRLMAGDVDPSGVDHCRDRR